MSDPVALLSKLVSFRTDLVEGNERLLADHYAELLAVHTPDSIEVGDVPRANGQRSASWTYARFGEPKVLVNAHLDTVPPNTEWSAESVHRARQRRQGLPALGACDDTKARLQPSSARSATRGRKTSGSCSPATKSSRASSCGGSSQSPHMALPRAAPLSASDEPSRRSTRHRGFDAFEVTIDGPGGHSSRADFDPLADRAAFPARGRLRRLRAEAQA